MKTKSIVTGTLVVVLTVLALPALSQIRAFDGSRLNRLLPRLHELDFEEVDVSWQHGPGLVGQQIPNPLRLDGVTFTDPHRLGGGFCSAPTCEPDPDNAIGGNISLFLNPGGTISFRRSPKLVVLDIQGIGDNPFTLLVTDRRGRRVRVRAQGKLFGVTLVGLFSGAGIRRVEVVHVGGTGGPLALARVLYSRDTR